MTEALKRFSEIVSAADEEYIERLKKASIEEVIAMAAEKGVELTKADFEPSDEHSDEISLDELNAVAGGNQCECVFAGGGVQHLTENDDGTESGEGGCGCFAYGVGDSIDHDVHRGHRCECPVQGTGYGI